MSQRAQRVSTRGDAGDPCSSTSALGDGERRAEREHRRLELGQWGVVAAQFRAARYLQIHVNIAAAVGGDQRLDQLRAIARSSCGLRMRSSSRLRARRARCAASRRALTAPGRDHLVHAIAEQEAAIERRDARLAQRQQPTVEMADRQRIGHARYSWNQSTHVVAPAGSRCPPSARPSAETAAPTRAACRRRRSAIRPTGVSVVSGAISGCCTLALVSMLPAWPRGTTILMSEAGPMLTYSSLPL